MPIPIDLVQQGAMLDFVEMLDRFTQRGPENAHIFQSNGLLEGRPLTRQRTLTDTLDDFVRSPSPIPGGDTNSFSTPTPFVSQARLLPNRSGGLTFANERPQSNTDLDLLESIGEGTLTNATTQSGQDLATFGLRTDDPFGTPDTDRTRSILRRLVDRV